VSRDFEALSQIIGRHIEAWPSSDCADLERLRRAKEAADKGAALAKKPAKFF